MDTRDSFLAQLERETALTRRVLERVPEGRNDWKPHAKSMAMGLLAALVANMPGWAAFIIEHDELNFDHPSSDALRSKPVATQAELQQLLEDGAARSRRALEGTDLHHLGQRWRLISGGRTLINEPRYNVLADTVFSHLAHHRGQLTVYLRLNDAAVPAIYGPTADEQS